MDNEFQELEAELRRLRPVAPPLHLQEEIGRELAGKTAARSPRRLWWLAAPLTAAAAVALAVFVGGDRKMAEPAALTVAAQPTAPPRPVFTPVAAAKLPPDFRDERLVTLADGTVARRTREIYLTTITWKDPRTNASLRWSVPREDVRMVPVSYQ